MAVVVHTLDGTKRMRVMQLHNLDVRCSLRRRRAWQLGFLAGQLQGKGVGDHTSETVLAEAAILLRTTVEHLNASQLLGIGPAIEVLGFLTRYIFTTVYTGQHAVLLQRSSRSTLH